MFFREVEDWAFLELCTFMEFKSDFSVTYVVFYIYIKLHGFKTRIIFTKRIKQFWLET